MEQFKKYGKTEYFSFSEKVSREDRKLSEEEEEEYFGGKYGVASLKLDGENTTIVRQKYYARSINSISDESRHNIGMIWGRINYLLEDGERIIGENLRAVHTISYENDTQINGDFYVFSHIKNGIVSSVSHTKEICEKFGLLHVPIIYEGIFDRKKILEEFKKYPNHEGFVFRLSDSFDEADMSKSIAKFVSNSFEIKTNIHWQQAKKTIFKNGKIQK